MLNLKSNPNGSLLSCPATGNLGTACCPSCPDGFPLRLGFTPPFSPNNTLITGITGNNFGLCGGCTSSILDLEFIRFNCLANKYLYHPTIDSFFPSLQSWENYFVATEPSTFLEWIPGSHWDLLITSSGGNTAQWIKIDAVGLPPQGVYTGIGSTLPNPLTLIVTG